MVGEVDRQGFRHLRGQIAGGDGPLSATVRSVDAGNPLDEGAEGLIAVSIG